MPSKSQHKVREGCKAFGKRIDEYHQQRQRREVEAKRVEFKSREHENQRGGGHESPAEPARQQTCGNVARPSARIPRIDIGIHQAVEGHRGGPRSDHRDHDPGDHSPFCGRSESRLAKREQRAGQGEGKCENRMLELDHVERQPYAP
jgi:hypothetical protein